MILCSEAARISEKKSIGRPRRKKYFIDSIKVYKKLKKINLISRQFLLNILKVNTILLFIFNFEK